MNRAVVSMAFGPYWHSIADVSWPSQQRYADSVSADFVFARNIPPHHSHPAPWAKLTIIADALSEYDEILWLDADVVAVGFGRSVFDESPASASISAVLLEDEPGSSTYHFNTGVIVARRSAISSIVMAALQDDLRDHRWWEQAALIRVCDNIHSLDAAWNVWTGVEGKVSDPVFMHACGLHGPGEQLAKVKEWAG